MATISVLDPDAATLHLANLSLGGAGHTVRSLKAGCLHEVLVALHAGPPDLLILEVGLFGCPANTLIRACRTDPHLKAMRILVLSAKPGLDLAGFREEVGDAHYLAKPVSGQELVAAVETLLDPDGRFKRTLPPATRGTLALVDDSPLSRAFRTACLRRRGYRVVAVPPVDLLGTVQILEAARPRLLLVDFLAPQFRGDVLIRALRARPVLRETPVLLITAHRADELTNLIRPLAGVEMLFKPVTEEDLADWVQARL